MCKSYIRNYMSVDWTCKIKYEGFGGGPSVGGGPPPPPLNPALAGDSTALVIFAISAVSRS